MARKPTGNPIGPPPKEIDWKLFEQLCSFQCTQSEIASCLKIHIDTLRDRCAEQYGEEYSNVYKKYSEEGKCSLRRYQFVQAKTKPNMAIWLGKQWLSQKDTFDAVAPSNDKMLGDILHEVKSMKGSIEAPQIEQIAPDNVNAFKDILDSIKKTKESSFAPIPETDPIDTAGDAQV
jgi:hypothetical protein